MNGTFALASREIPIPYLSDIYDVCELAHVYDRGNGRSRAAVPDDCLRVLILCKWGVSRVAANERTIDVADDFTDRSCCSEESYTHTIDYIWIYGVNYHI